MVEVQQDRRQVGHVQASAFNRRITAADRTSQITGPARGNALLVTKYSTDGTQTRGTLNNCGTGKTPWGTFLTGEENWSGYFTRGAGDDAARGNDKSVTSLNRYGRTQGAASRHGWETRRQPTTTTRAGTSARPVPRRRQRRLPQRNERLGLHRRDRPLRQDQGRDEAHRASAASRTRARPSASRSPASRWPSTWATTRAASTSTSSSPRPSWDAADANPADRMATGDKYLDSGKLYVAKFNADGTRRLDRAVASPTR